MSTSHADRSAARLERLRAKLAAPKRKPQRKPPAIPADTYQCVLCRKHFADAVAFRAHHVHRFMPIERCLDSQELTALDFSRSKAGVWGTSLVTLAAPSQVARLATVRQEREAFEAA